MDVHVGEKRNAFPLTVPPGENRIVWIDLFTPVTASAGITTHTITVTGSGGFSVALTLNLTVFSFALPTTPSMSSLFGHGADWATLAKAHGTTSDAETTALTKRYIKTGLMHRVSFADFLGYGSPQ